MNKRALVFASLLFALPASAGEPVPNNKQAEQLFREGRKLMEAGKYVEACTKLGESQRLDPAAGTLLNLADCYEKTQRNADAIVTYREAAKAAALRNRLDWITTANQRIAALEPKVGTITVTLHSGAELRDLKIERDGSAIAPEAIGTALPTEPGVHFIAASAPARKSWSTRVEVGAGKKVSVEIPVLEIEGAPEKPTPPTTPSPPQHEEDGSSTRILGFAALGVGIVGVGVGTFTGIKALSLQSDASAKCPSYPDRCDADAVGPNDDAKTMATVSTVSLIAGGVLALAGIVLVVTAPSGKERSTSIRLTPAGAAGVF